MRVVCRRLPTWLAAPPLMAQPVTGAAGCMPAGQTPHTLGPPQSVLGSWPAQGQALRPWAVWAFSGRLGPPSLLLSSRNTTRTPGAPAALLSLLPLPPFTFLLFPLPLFPSPSSPPFCSGRLHPLFLVRSRDLRLSSHRSVLPSPLSTRLPAERCNTA
ncbi:hypothetical protein M432DRAFT_30461 [Thermoascus aurantiacus ATCC 26904]